LTLHNLNTDGIIKRSIKKRKLPSGLAEQVFSGNVISCNIQPETSCFLSRNEVKAHKAHASHRYGAKLTEGRKFDNGT
jgi:hypothetical protein